MLLDHRGNPITATFAREDRWENRLTGIGTMQDKTTHGRFFPAWRIPDQELISLFNGSDLAAKAAAKRPYEMFRRGYDLRPSKPTKAAANSNGKSKPLVTEEEIETIRDFANDTLDLDTNVLEGKVFGRLLGGALLILGADDGGMPWEPLDETRIRSFNFVNIVDRRYAYVQSTYSRRGQTKYGKPQIYLLSNAIAHTGWDERDEAVTKRSPQALRDIGADIALVHESRVIRFEGAPADITTRQMLGGWTFSVLQRVYQAMRSFEHDFDAASYLLSDASQGVLKIRGLFKALAGGAQAKLAQRGALAEMSRSVMRMLVLDAGEGDAGKNAESFERVATTFSGIPEMLDRKMLRLCAAMDVPANELFGQGGGGLNAAGEAQAATRKWYDSIETDQTTELAPVLKRIYRLISLAKQGPLRGRDVKWQIDFKPLWSPTDTERATTQLQDAQRRAADITSQVITPEEGAMSAVDVYPDIDLDARRTAMAGAKSFDPYENDEPDPPPPPDGHGGEPGSPAVPTTPIQREAPPGADKEARADFDSDQPRDEGGRFAAGGGGGGSSGGSSAASSDAGKGLAAQLRAGLSGAASAARHAGRSVAHRALEKAKETIGEVKTALAGASNALRGHPVTEEQRGALKKVALHVAIAVASHGIASALPIGFIHAELGRKAVEKIAHHISEKALGKILHLVGVRADAAAEVAARDPERWLSDAIAEMVARELETLPREELEALVGESAAQ